MANVKITELTAATALAGTDVLPIVDVGADATKKVSVSDLLRNLPDGTASAPALAFADDQNTGVLSPGNNSLAFATSGTQRLVIDSSGNCGIGTTSPGAGLDVVGNSTMLRLYDGTNTSTGKISQSSNVITLSQAGTSSGALAFATGSGALGTERMRIDGSGKIGIGTTSPQVELHLNDATGLSRIRLSGGASSADNFEFGQGTTGVTNGGFEIRDVDASATRFVIDSSGRVGIGATSPDALLDVENSSGASEIQIKSLNASDCTLAFGDNADTDVGRIRYAHSADAMLFFTAATERARIDSSGNVIVGTSSTVNPVLRILGSSAHNSFIQFADGDSNNVGQIQYSHSSNALITAVNGSERMRIDSSGRLLVGASSDVTGSTHHVVQAVTTGGGRITLARNDTSVTAGDVLGQLGFSGNDANGSYQQVASITCEADGTHGDNDKPGRLRFMVTADNASSPTERMRITSGGTVRIGSGIIGDNTNGPGEQLSGGGFLRLVNSTFNSSATCFEVRTGTPTTSVRMVIRNDGDLENVNNSYGAYSDVRYKENIVNARPQWDDIKNIKIRNYNFTEESGFATHTQIGVVAQELETVCPGLVTDSAKTDEDGNPTEDTHKTVAYSVLYVKAIKALQEAMERIETLEAKVAALEAQ